MPSPLRGRALRTLAAVMLFVALLAPGSAPALAADGEPLVLRAGTDQDLQVLTPWNSVVVADFEVFTLNYDTLVGSARTSNRWRALPNRGSSPRTG